MLAFWPIVTIMLFVLLPAHRALIWSVLGAYLVLPVNTSFEIPGVPSLDKTTISNLSILLCCCLFVRENWTAALRQPGLMALAATFILSPFLTAFFNPEPLIYADRFIPAMTMYDAFAQAAVNGITLIPFIAAVGLINTDQRRWQVIAILVTAALAYSVLMLIEVRLSPQLHRMVYGFFPHSFAQQMRSDGFRPTVFLGHGLLVAIFCAMAVVAAIAKWRTMTGRPRFRAGLISLYLGMVLVLCKSLGAVLLLAIFGPVLAYLRSKRVAAIAGLICVLMLIYPALRASGALPTTMISEWTSSYSAERAGSLGVRLSNEEALLQRASQKPLFGWGSWGRNRIYSADDGRSLSITDGAWIIALSTWGWVGYLATFGLIGYGSIRILFNITKRRLEFSSAVVAVILAVNLLDSIPNSSINSFTWLLSGIAAGLCISRKSQNEKMSNAASRSSVDQPAET